VYQLNAQCRFKASGLLSLPLRTGEPPAGSQNGFWKPQRRNLASGRDTLRSIVNADQSERLTVRQASERLGISVEAVRARLSRGTLQRETGPDGTVYVVLHGPPRSDQSNDQTLLLQRADSEIAYLRQRLAEADERDREQRRIIAALTSRIPELPEATGGPPDEQRGRARYPGTPRT
jgi:hypothetical protein